MPPIFAPAAPLPSPADAFAIVEPELWALPVNAVLPPCLDLRYAAQTAMQTARRVEGMLPELAMLPGFDLGPVRRLGLYAAAMLHAEWILESEEQTPGYGTPLEAISEAKDRWLRRRELRARAYTLLVHAYDQCRRGVTFLRWPYGDLEHFVPPLHPTRALGRTPDDSGRISLEGTWLRFPTRSDADASLADAVTVTAH